MAVYSIKDVEKLTGIRAHTLRSWELRHGLVAPRRVAGNARRYREEDLKELSAIALLHKHGYRISKIVAMSREERNREVATVSSLNVGAANQLDALTLSVVEMDEYRFSLIIDTNIEQRGFEETMREMVYPFLDKLNVLFFTGSVTAVQESFAAGLLRRKIMAAIDRLEWRPSADLPTFGLFLPEGEQQELAILFAKYLLRRRGFRVIYLGTNTEPQDLGDACRVTHIDYLFTVLSTTYVAHPVEQLVKDILDCCTGAKLVLTGYQATLHDFADNPRLLPLAGLEELLALTEELSTPAGRSIAAN